MPTSPAPLRPLPPHGQRRLTRLAAYGIGAIALLTVGTIRLTADQFYPGLIPPFFLLYPAVLIACLVGSWRSGLTVLFVGSLFTWNVVMQHSPLRAGQRPATTHDIVQLALFVVSAGIIVVATGIYRRHVRRAREQQVTEVEAKLATATSDAGMGVWEWRNGEIIASAQAKAICGLPAGDILTPQLLWPRIALRDRPAAEARLAQAADPAVADYRPFEFRIVMPDGASRWIAVSGHAVDDGTGARRIVGAVVDITARKTAEDALAAAADRLHQVSEAARLAVWQVDREKGLIHDPDLNAVLGFPPDARLTADDVRSLYMPGELARLREISAASWARGQRNIEVEAQIRRPDGVVRWVMLRGELGLDQQGQVRAAFGMTVDITERKEEEERLSLMAQEVNHRANNLLAVVQGAVQLSKAPTSESFKEVVLGRIAAVGRAHQLLAQDRWEGLDLGRLVQEELAPYSLGDARRVRTLGPETPLSLVSAQALALALHELATNAAKYGSLSTPAGRVEVSWTLSPEKDLTLVWRESGGPRISVPERQGQGTALLSQALGGSLEGSCAMEWRPGGLVCTLTLPAAALEWAGPEAAS